MARKGQVSIQDTVETNEEFEAYLVSHYNQLICLEVYSEFCGYCLATGNAIRKGKLELGQDRIAMVKALADNIEVLSRFKDKSEPVFLFICKGQLTRAMFGANGIELCKIIEEELALMQREQDTGVVRPKLPIDVPLPEEEEAWALMKRKQDSGVVRPKSPIDVPLPEEELKLQEELRLEEEYREQTVRLQQLTQAARKRRVNERMSIVLKNLNYIMFWPHCHQAHFDLYEKWDVIRISVANKDTFQLDEHGAKEALYMSDVDPNEACLHALLNGPVLVTLFKNDDQRDFIKLLRYALYEEIPVPKEDVPPEKQVPPIPAFERYASISKTAREVRRDRYEAKMAKLREEQEERDRLAAEQARLAREAEEDRQREEKKRLEEEKMARIQAGLPASPEPEEGQQVEEEQLEETGEVVVEEEVKEEVEPEEEFHSDVEVPDEEYIPPGGMFVPGLYCPPNELAKANGLAFFYPKVVSELIPIESEFLPPHILVMFHIDKRHEVQEIIKQYANEVLALGIFVGDDPYSAEHIAYSIKQYDEMERARRHKDRLALMVSRKRSLPILQLAGLNPCYISADTACGEKDCLQLFPVGYGDDFIEEESVVEEEVEVVEQVPEPPPVEQEAPPEQKEDEDEDEGE